MMVTSTALSGQQSNFSKAREEAATPDSPAAAQTQTADAAPVQAAVPHLIKFNGTLHDLSGKPVSGPVDVTFSLYAQETGGSSLWFETQTVQADALGHYTVLLGAMTPTGVPMELFTAGEARWLGVQVSNLPEQSRVLLVSVPYAMKAGDAETLGGKPASAYMLNSQSGSSADTSGTTNTTSTAVITSTTSGTTTTNSTPITQATTQNYIPKFADNGGTLTDSAMFQSGNSIGINTNAPAFGLDLNSNVFAVGTKTAAPGAGGTMRFRDDTGTVRWLFGIPGTAGSQDFFMYNYTNGHEPIFIANDAPSYSFYFASNGNVGIGTTSPAHKLDVAGDINASGTISGDGSGLTNVGSSSTVILGSTATFTGDVSTSSNLNLPATTSDGTGGVITFGRNPFIHVCCSSSTFNTFVGVLAGNFSADDTGTIAGGTGDNTAVGESALHDLTSGFQNTAIGAYSLFGDTTGPYNTASGYQALYVSVGRLNTASGYQALYSNSTGDENTALGDRADVTTGDLTFATAIGACSKVSASNALVLGAVANGCGSSGYPSATTKVGIGTPTPNALLDVSTGSTDVLIGDAGCGANYAGVGFGTSMSSCQDYSLLGNGTDTILNRPYGGNLLFRYHNATQMIIDVNGAVGINTTSPDRTLSVNGYADKIGGGSWDTFSDARLKNVTGGFHLGLAEIMKINPVVYRYKRQNALGIKDHAPHVGVVAQQVEKAIPQAVSKEAKGYLVVNNDPIIFAMLNAIKEQQKEIVRKDAQVRALNREVEQLKKQASVVVALEARLARDEAQQKVTRTKLARVEHRQKRHVDKELARVRF